MAVAILMGNCKGACIYPTREDLVYWRAVYDGMAPRDSDGEENDPHKYFRKVDYEYLGSEHLKGVSSKRSELCWHEGRAAGVWNVHQVQLEESQDRRAVGGAEGSEGETDE
jgi:hypothetical protein